MSERHPLASPDSWVELRDATELRAGDAMDIEDAVTGPGMLKVRRELTDGVITALVTNWSLPLPIPSKAPQTPQDPGSLRLMEIKDYAALKKLVAAAEDIIFPGDPEPEDEAALEAAKEDEASPTGDADAS